MKDDEDGARHPKRAVEGAHRELLSRREALRRGAAAAALISFLGEAEAAGEKIDEPHLPCGTLVIGGGYTEGMFNALEKNRMLPGRKSWKEFLKGKQVICIGCAAGRVEDSDAQNKASIESWCLKQDVVANGELQRFSKQKGVNFYRGNGAKEITFIKDADWNKEHEEAIVRAIKHKDTCFFDFAGGDQEVMMKILRQTPRIMEALKQRWIADPNLLAYTTSASASALSKHMMNNGEILEGLGWLDNIIVDQHIHNSQEKGKVINRIPRLQNQVKKHPGLIGIGVDEATALVLRREYKTEGGEAVERMTGTVLAAMDDFGKVRYPSDPHNVYVVCQKDCDKAEEAVPSFKPLTGPDAPAVRHVDGAMLTRYMKLPEGRFKNAMKSLPPETQKDITTTLKSLNHADKQVER